METVPPSCGAGRVFASVAVGAALVLACASQAGAAADLTEPTVTSEGGLQVMHLIGHETEGRFIPKGGEPVAHPTADPRAGDGFSFSEELRQNGTLVATAQGLCTILPGNSRAARCEVAVTFGQGTMTAVGEGTEDQKESTYKLTGGTGAYEGVSGIVRAKELSETDSDLTFPFKTPGHAAPPTGAFPGDEAAQVAVVPVGGAATGGGLAPDGAERGLVGLGALAAAAGAGLLGFGRRFGRRAG